MDNGKGVLHPHGNKRFVTRNGIDVRGYGEKSPEEKREATGFLRINENLKGNGVAEWQNCAEDCGRACKLARSRRRTNETRKVSLEDLGTVPRPKNGTISTKSTSHAANAGRVTRRINMPARTP